MKNSHSPLGAAGAAASLSPSAALPSSIDEASDPVAAVPVPAGAVRILLGLDVPAGALPEIEGDWARITEAQQVAPDLVPAMIDVALERLRRLTLGVSGVAAARPVESPFARWVHHAA